MKHQATPHFWQAQAQLPPEIQRLTDKNQALWKEDALHPSVHFKKVGRFWSARVGLHYRALGVEAVYSALVWCWIGRHEEYDRLAAW